MVLGQTSEKKDQPAVMHLNGDEREKQNLRALFHKTRVDPRVSDMGSKCCSEERTGYPRHKFRDLKKR